MTSSHQPNSAGLTALIQSAPDTLDVWGRSPADRTHRELTKLQVPVTEDEMASAATSPVLALRGDAIFHHSVLQGMIKHPDTALTDGAGQPLAIHVSEQSGADNRQAALAWLQGNSELPAGIQSAQATDVADLYNRTLRRRNDPYALRVDRETLPGIEKRIFMSTYKGVTDLVTKYWWPVPARIVTKWCVKLGLTPNVVTIISAILAVVVCFLFVDGRYGTGLALGWVMTFLDTVDGKLARVTLTSSKFGDVLDHGIDLLHPLAWYYTWGMGLAVTGHGGHFAILMWLIFGGYVAGRLCEGFFIKRHGFHIHVWRRFDSGFRLVLARRNPNMIMLTLAALVGRPDVGLWLVAGWTVATLLIHLGQIIQAEGAARQTPLRSWLDATPDSNP